VGDSTGRAGVEWYRDSGRVLETVRAVAADTPAPPMIEGFVIERELGHGGQGVVYLGEQTLCGRRVAIKVLSGDWEPGDARVRRFEREIELVESLDHPGIVSLLDSGLTACGRRCLVMDFVEGVAWDLYLRQGVARDGAAPLRDDVIRAFIGVCAAIEHAHRRGMIHRDIKPSNIRVGTDGTARVLDFGLAKSRFGPPGDDLTDATGRFMGSLSWASPEQADGRLGEVDVRGDIYSLGVVLFHALTGEMPYTSGGGLREQLDKIVQEPARSPRSIDPSISPDLERVVLRCLRKDPDDRYQHAGDLERDLGRVLAGEPIEISRDRSLGSLQRRLSRYRSMTAAGVLGLLVLGVIASALWTMYARADRAEALALKRLSESRAANSRAETVIGLLEDLVSSAAQAGESPLAQELIAALQAASGELAMAHDPALEARLRFAMGHASAVLSRWDEAEESLRRAVALNTTVHGPEHPEVGASLMRLGDVLARQASPSAPSLRTESLRLSLQLDGAAPIDLYLRLLGRPPAYGRSRGSAEARDADDTYQRAIAIYRGHEDAFAKELAAALCARAELLMALAEPQAASSAFDESLRLFRAHTSPDDPARLDAMASGAQAYFALGRARESARLYEEVADRASEVYADAIRPALLWRAASAYVESDDPASAERLFRKAIVEECRQVARRRPEDASELLAIAERLGSFSGESADAADYQSALTAIRRSVDSTGPNDSALYRELGLTLLRAGFAERAEPMVRQAHAISTGAIGHDAPELTQCKGALGICLARLGYFEESEALLLKSYELATRMRSQRERHSELALSRLVELYRRWDKPERAEAYENVLNSG